MKNKQKAACRVVGLEKSPGGGTDCSSILTGKKTFVFSDDPRDPGVNRSGKIVAIMRRSFDPRAYTSGAAKVSDERRSLERKSRTRERIEQRT